CSSDLTYAFAGTEFTTHAGDLVNGNTVTSVSLSSGGAAMTATVTSPGPDYAITASNAAGSGLGNYSISYNPGTLTVTPRDLAIKIGRATNRERTTHAFAATEFTTH